MNSEKVPQTLTSMADCVLRPVGQAVLAGMQAGWWSDQSGPDQQAECLNSRLPRQAMCCMPRGRRLAMSDREIDCRAWPDRGR